MDPLCLPENFNLLVSQYWFERWSLEMLATEPYLPLLACLLTYLLDVDAGDEMEQKQQMEEQLIAFQDKKRYKKRQIRELDEDLRVSLCLQVTLWLSG